MSRKRRLLRRPEGMNILVGLERRLRQIGWRDINRLSSSNTLRCTARKGSVTVTMDVYHDNRGRYSKVKIFSKPRGGRMSPVGGARVLQTPKQCFDKAK